MENVFHLSQFKQRSHDIFFSWTFDLPLINSSRYLLFGFYFSPHHRSIISDWIQAPKKTNHEIKTRIFTCFFHEIKTNIFTCFLNIKLKNSLWTIFTFFQFPIFRRSRSQMLFKISALKDFAIFWIKKKLQQRWFFCEFVNFLTHVWCMKTQTHLFISLSSIVGFSK